MDHDPLDFWKKYQSIGSTSTWDTNLTKESVCRYCGKKQGEVTFDQNTHLIPELLGENDIHTTDECDHCNGLFSKNESHLSKFVRPYLTMLAVKGKKKIPIFQSRTLDGNEETRTKLEVGAGTKRELLIQDLDDYKIDADSKTMSITFRKEPYRPLSVYKSLLKIALGLLPRKYDTYNRKTFEWITNKRDEIQFFPVVFITTLKRRYFEHPFAELYRAKSLCTSEEEFPEHTLILGFANQVVQIFLPFSDELLEVNNGKRPLSFNLFPAFSFDKLNESTEIEIKQYDLSGTAMVKENQHLHFSFEELNRKVDLNNKENGSATS